jgi:hypothetical protein
MIARRWASAALLATLTAVSALACSFVQSLDYLQDGDPIAGDGGPEGGSETKVPIAIAPSQTAPGLLAQDATALYWLSQGVVMTLPKAGGTARALGTVAGALRLAVDPDPGGAVYLAVGTDVFRLPKDGSPGATIFKPPVGSPLADTLLADDSALFVLQYDENVGDSQIVRMARDGGLPAVLVPDSGSAPSTLNADPRTLVWLDTDITNGAFLEHDKSANGPVSKTLALGANDDTPLSSANIAVDDTTIYWATDGSVGPAAVLARKRDLAGSVLKLFVGTDEKFGPIAIDTQSVYATLPTAGAILRVSKQGGDGKRIVTGLVGPSSIVVDDTTIYFTVEGDGIGRGAVMKLAK